MGLSFGQQKIFSQDKQYSRRNTLCISRLYCAVLGKKIRCSDGKHIFKLSYKEKPDRLQSDPTVKSKAKKEKTSSALHR